MGNNKKKILLKIKSSLSLQSRIKGCKKIIKKNKFIEVKFYENKIKSNNFRPGLIHP